MVVQIQKLKLKIHLVSLIFIAVYWIINSRMFITAGFHARSVFLFCFWRLKRKGNFCFSWTTSVHFADVADLKHWSFNSNKDAFRQMMLMLSWPSVFLLSKFTTIFANKTWAVAIAWSAQRSDISVQIFKEINLINSVWTCATPSATSPFHLITESLHLFHFSSFMASSTLRPFFTSSLTTSINIFGDPLRLLPSSPYILILHLCMPKPS